MAAFQIVAAEAVKNEPSDLYPHANELIVGAIAFAVLFVFMWKWVLPRADQMLDQRRAKIQGDLEQAESARRQAEGELSDYRAQLAGAREEADRIIEEARRTADQLRADLQAKAEQESQAIVARAQDEIRAERDRVFQELRAQVAEVAVGLAGRVVGETLDAGTHQRLIDRYIEEVTATGNGKESGPE
jgi:F-type H+-transporting ATPase subunit b